MAVASPKPVRKSTKPVNESQKGTSVGRAKPANQSILDQGLSEGVMSEMKQNGAKLHKGVLVHPPAKAKPPKSKKQGMADGITVKVYQESGRKEEHAMTVEEAMELIGWTVVDDGPHQLTDANGSKIRLANNSTNRPFRPGIFKRYMSEVLRNKWALNGETIIFDWDGKCQSGQHRLVAFIMAVEYWRKDKAKWGKYHKSQPTMECIVVHGIDPSPEVVDTIDQGQKRTIGDVFFRDQRFGVDTKPLSLGEGKNTLELPVMGDKTRQKLCNILAGAARLVWLRSNKNTVSDAKHFPVSEAVDFIKDHPGLLYAVVFINGLEGGDSKDGHKISRFLSLGYASAMFYLMATSGTEYEDYLKEGAAAVDFKMKKKAQEFWGKFASGAELKADDPIFVARELLPQINAGSAVGRDEIVVTITHAFNAFADGKKVKSKDLGVRKRVEGGITKLLDNPHLGGLDVEGIEPPLEDVSDQSDDREGTKSKKGWAEGDTCWVKGQDGDNWFGTIQEVIKAEKGCGEDVAMLEADDGNVWEEKLSKLSLKYPG